MSKRESEWTSRISMLAIFGGVVLSIVGATHIGSAQFIEAPGWTNLGIAELIAGIAITGFSVHVNLNS